MKTISEVNIDEIYSPTAKWYIILLEDYWADPVRGELEHNAAYLAEVVGPYVWVIRGHSRKRNEFFSAIYHRYRLNLGDYPFEKFPRPALLLTNSVPPVEDLTDEDFNGIIRIVFPLVEHYVKAGSISDFLNSLALTLQKPDALENLESLNEKSLMDTWGWILDYFEIKPSFLGVSLDVNKIIKAVTKK